MADKFEEMTPKKGQGLIDWVTARTDSWRDYREQNYRKRWEEYERLWRGEWEADDRSRDSERSRVIAPALQQALETHVAETTEAVFGFGKFFDIAAPKKADPQHALAVEQIKTQLVEDLSMDKFRKYVEDTVFMGGIYGNGIAEIVVKDKKQLTPATQSIPGADFQAFGVKEIDRFSVYPRPINPKNFLIDPNATSIDDALGCAVEEPVSIHVLIKGMEDGIYRKCAIGTSTHVDEKEGLQEDLPFQKDFTYILKYYGLVPKDLLEQADKDNGEEIVNLFDDEVWDSFGELVEAVVVIADGFLLKAVENPYMMGDRPIVAYQDDTVPGKFWGRGVMEKGYNMQKALDAQLRAHLDSLALTTAPMVAIDASRLPRGMKFEVKPGRTLLTNGNPAEIVQPFQFGQTTDQNAVQAREFERMLLQATGTVDASGMPSSVNRDTTASGMSMALSALIKKNKRTLINFQEQFLIPVIEKITWRYMQFDPERYPATYVKFIPASSLGIMAREFEQQQYIGLLQTLGPESPIVPLLLKSIIQNSSIQNKEELSAQLEQMSQPNPEEQQRKQQQEEMQLQMVMAKAQADIQEIQSRIQLNTMKAQAIPEELKIKYMSAMTTNLDEDPEDKNFEKRLRIAEVALKERDLDLKELDISSNERIATFQMAGTEPGMTSVFIDKLEELMNTEEELVRDDEGNIVGKRRKKRKSKES